MNKNLWLKTDAVLRKYHVYTFKDIALFIGLQLVFHILWRLLIGDLLSVGFIHQSSVFLAHQVYLASQWVLDLLGVQITAFDTMTIGKSIQHNVLYIPDYNGYVSVKLSCSGLKQFYQFFFLMLLYPGPWRHKLWFIPLGLLIIHFVNIGRIVSMVYVTMHDVENWDFWHDSIVRPFFYVVMFFLWVYWNEKFYLKRKKKEKKEENSPQVSVPSE